MTLKQQNKVNNMNSRRNSVQGISLNYQKQPNLGLWLDKFIVDHDKNSQSKSKLVTEVTGFVEPKENWIYKNYFENVWQQNLLSFGAKCRRAKVKNRLAINLGSESVLETSIALHRLFGVPFIPGSALKGLVSHFLHQYGGSDWKIQSENHTIVFGNQENAGFITFYDAFYVPESGFNRKPLYSDVMTTHHSDYYGGSNAPPADWDSPNPVPFISATGEFLIALSGPADWVELTFEILGYALQIEGIGAKTSSGYGRMSFSSGFILSEAEIEEKKSGKFKELFDEMEKLVSGDKETKKEVKKKLKNFTKNLQRGNTEHEKLAHDLNDKASELGIKDELLQTDPDWFKPIRLILGE